MPMLFEEAFDVMRYPAGEPHITLRESGLHRAKHLGDTRIIANAYDFNDLSLIKLGDDILKDNRIQVEWLIPYMPFARHDRKRDHLDSVPLRVAFKILEGVDYTIVDPHSDVAGIAAHYTQADVVYLYRIAGLFIHHPTVVIPDLGATKKVYTWLYENDLKSIQYTKVRDTGTGKLSGFKMVDTSPGCCQNDYYVLVDDICDGGGTFIGIAEDLKKTWPNAVIDLAVTHGLFTKGLDELKKHFRAIYTLNTCKIEDSCLVKVDAGQLFDRRFTAL